jgi:hypothetical protein
MHSKDKRERERSTVRLKYFIITLSSTVVSLLGGSLPNDGCVRIVAAELKLVVSAACSSCDIILRGNIRPLYYSKHYNPPIRANYFHVFGVQMLAQRLAILTEI